MLAREIRERGAAGLWAISTVGKPWAVRGCQRVRGRWRGEVVGRHGRVRVRLVVLRCCDTPPGPWLTIAFAAPRWLPRVDDWFTEHYAGEDWRSSGLAGTLPWKELPLSSVWAPLTGMALYLVGTAPQLVLADTVVALPAFTCVSMACVHVWWWLQGLWLPRQ